MAQLRIPDHLAPGPLHSNAVARVLNCDSEAIHRLLRGAARAGLVSRVGDGRFTLTPLGQLLRSDVPRSLRDFAVALTASGHWLPWGRLAEAVRSGERQALGALGLELFDYYAAHPAEGKAFVGAMDDTTAEIATEVCRLVDTSNVAHVVDVGGSSGVLLRALLGANPRLRGTILELHHVLPEARAAVAKQGLGGRCDVVAGDFFHSIPAADIHILKYILHDWDDAQSVRILANCARVLATNGRVILVERVMAEDEPSDAALDDLNMLVLLPGRERTLKQYAGLLERAGLRLERAEQVRPPCHLIEARPAARMV